eukprot:378774-Prymnesium_polylepis.3
MPSVELHHGMLAYLLVASRHGFTISGGVLGVGSGAPEQLTAPTVIRQYPPHFSFEVALHAV